MPRAGSAGLLVLGLGTPGGGVHPTSIQELSTLLEAQSGHCVHALLAKEPPSY